MLFTRYAYVLINYIIRTATIVFSIALSSPLFLLTPLLSVDFIMLFWYVLCSCLVAVVVYQPALLLTVVARLLAIPNIIAYGLVTNTSIFTRWRLWCWVLTRHTEWFPAIQTKYPTGTALKFAWTWHFFLQLNKK